MIAAKIGRRGQMTIPRSVRQWLHLQEGDRVVFVREGDRVIVYPLKRTLLDLRGSIPVSEPQDFDAIRKEVVTKRAQQRGKP